MAQPLSSFDWDDLRFFLAVSRAKSIRGAAEAMNANHATVSRRLTALENAVEARLFDRTKSGLRITQLGEELLPFAYRVEEEVAHVSRTIVGRDKRPSGTVYVSLPPFLALSSVCEDLAEFGRQFEEIDIHLNFSNDYADLGRREADVSIRYAREVTDDVVGRKLVGCAKSVYCSPMYAEKIKDDGGVGLNWIGWEEAEGETSASWVKKSPFPHALIRHRAIDGAPQIALAAAGAGLTALPCFVGDRASGLVRAPYCKPEFDRYLWLLLHSDLRRTARIRAVVDFLAARIKSRSDEFLVGVAASSSP
jgi:DNA-binding transcriptional LysR family regulator